MQFSSMSYEEFRAYVAQLQAEQDARAAQQAEEGSEQTLIIRRGDEVFDRSGEDGIIRVTPGEDGPVVEGDVPENAVLEVAQGPDAVANPGAPSVIATANGEEIAPVVVSEPAPEAEPEAEADITADPVAEAAPIVEMAPVAEAAPVVEEAPDAAPAPTEENRATIIRVTPGEDGPVVEGELPENAVLEVAQGPDAVENPGTPGVIITANTEQTVRNPEPAPEPAQVIDGTDGRDFLRGSTGNDVINGNAGRDRLTGGDGDDVLAGGTGRDVLDGGFGNDTFIYNEGDGFDRIRNFDLLGDDVLQLNVDGINSVEDFLGALTSTRDAGDAVNATFDFGGGDRLNITLDAVENLTNEDFIFG